MKNKIIVMMICFLLIFIANTANVKAVSPVEVDTYSPSADAVDVAVDSNLTLTFNQNIVKGTGNIRIYKYSDDTLVETIPIEDVSISDDVVTINPVNDLNYNCPYYVQIDAGTFKDISDNPYIGIIDNTTWRFRTSDATTLSFFISGGNNFTIGEHIEFWLRLNVGEGTTEKILLKDILPPGVIFESSTIKKGNDNISFNLLHEPSKGDTGELKWEISTIKNPANGINWDDTITVEYTIICQNVPSSVVSKWLMSNANLEYINWDGSKRTSPNKSNGFIIIEPKLTVETSIASDPPYKAGDEIDYQVTISHAGESNSKAYDIEIANMLPEALHYLFYTPNPSNPAIPNIDGYNITWGESGNIDLNVGSSITFNIHAVLEKDILLESDLTNTIHVKYSSLNGESPDERVYTASPSTMDVLLDDIVPSTTISSIISSPTNISSIPVTIDFNKAVTGFNIDDITVTNGTTNNFVMISQNKYTVDITPVTPGNITVDIADGVAQDTAGNGNLASGPFSIYSDNVAPKAVISSTETGATNLPSIPVTIKFNESVIGFDASDIMVGNGTVNHFVTVKENEYTVDILPIKIGKVTVDVRTGGAIDAVGNLNAASDPFSIDFDNTVLAIAIDSSETSPTNVSSIPVTIRFNKPVTGFDVTDITIGNGSIRTFSAISTDSYNIDITPTKTGKVTVGIAKGVAQDSAGNKNAASSQFCIDFDNTAPTIDLLSPINAANNTAIDNDLVLTFDEKIYKGMGNITLYKSYGDSVVEIIAVDDVIIDDKTVTINPINNLLKGTAYYVLIDCGIFKDATDNTFLGIEDKTLWHFTTVRKKSKKISGELEIEIDGKSQETIGQIQTQTQNGQIVTTIKVDAQKLNQVLDKKNQRVTLTAPAQHQNNLVVAALDGQIIKSMEKKESILEIKTETASYILPSQQIHIDEIAKQLGDEVALDDIRVEVKMGETSNEMVKVVDHISKKGEFALVVPPVEFTVTCNYKNQSIEIDQFSNYVERVIAIPTEVDHNKITTGIIVYPDGTICHVPTQIITIDGKHYTKIKSLTNSIYSVISNPKAFKDVESHWAKDACNEMASRMIITESSRELFHPDQDVNRLLFTQTVVRALGLGEKGTECPLKDVTKDQQYYGAVATAMKYKLISGYEDGTFRANNNITREEAATLIVRAMHIAGLKTDYETKVLNDELERFLDKEKISTWAKDAVSICAMNGLIMGNEKGEFMPKENMTKAQLATIMLRVLESAELI